MPYIKSDNDRREKLRNGETALCAGELNYQIFYFVKNYSKTLALRDLIVNIKVFVVNFLGDNPNYQRYNDLTGVMIRCGKEITRRLGEDKKYFELVLINIMGSYDDEIAKYEDTKIISNGDVE